MLWVVFVADSVLTTVKVQRPELIEGSTYRDYRGGCKVELRPMPGV
jgi:hypothetical protein